MCSAFLMPRQHKRLREEKYILTVIFRQALPKTQNLNSPDVWNTQNLTLDLHFAQWFTSIADLKIWVWVPNQCF